MRPVSLPRTLDELWRCLSDYPEAAVYAGGTDLLVKIRKGLASPSALICMERIEELKGVLDEGDRVLIGAGTTHARLLADPSIRKTFPLLVQALDALGSPHIRNMGTIGGNIVTASPAGDTLPPLYVLGAELELASKGGSRRVPMGGFIRGPGETILAPGEILAGVRLPKAREFNVRHFEKVGQRKALAISIASLAAMLRISEDGVVEEARLAWGSVGPTIITSPEAERAIEGRPLCLQVLEEAAGQARQAVKPIDDVRASAEYRRRVAGNLLMRLGEGAPQKGG